MIEITQIEMDHLLAGLRMLQWALNESPEDADEGHLRVALSEVMPQIIDIASEHEPLYSSRRCLTMKQIDDLCERLNCAIGTYRLVNHDDNLPS